MIVISSALVLSSLAPGASLNRPLVGWVNYVSTTTIAASDADPDYPATNLGNPSTASDMEWRANDGSPSLSDIYLTVSTGLLKDMDYIGLARHNFGSSGATLSVEYLDTTASPDEWVELVEPFMLADDKPVIIQWAPALLGSVRLRIQPGTAAPRLAVMYCGLLMPLPRNIYVGHTPIVYGRKTQVMTGRSERGDFLGRIVMNRTLESDVTMLNCPPAYFRDEIEPFFIASEEAPFFFAWRPYTYPLEVGFCWMSADGMMANQLPNGFVQFSFKFGALAE